MDVRDAFRRIRELAKLEKDWDSYDGEPPTGHALDAATILVDEIFQEHGLQPDWIGPIANGGIQVEYQSKDGKKVLEIDIDPDQTVERYDYLLVDKSGDTRKFEEKHEVCFKEILAMILSLLT